MNGNQSQNGAGAPYVLPPLPYDVGALEPLLDAETLSLHHDRHHAAYVNGANEAARILQMVSAGELDEGAAAVATRQLAFNLGGHLLHSLYWMSMSPQQHHEPGGRLAQALMQSYGSYEGFLRVFRGVALGIQGSGWCVLGVHPGCSRLTVVGIGNHQDALLPGFCPLLACDVWEHAYYLRYHNNRAAYVQGFLLHLNWEYAEQQYEHFCHE